MEISPKYIMSLIERVEKSIWDQFKTYKNVELYIKRWHEDNGAYSFSDYQENFNIHRKADDKIDLNPTLHGMASDLIIKMAIDLGIETPDFLPVVSEIRNVLKGDYRRASESFEKAIKLIEEDPDLAVNMANSTLESIIKHILENDDITIKYNSKDTLGKLCESLLKEFNMFPNADLPSEIKTIGSSLMAISNHIETLRSTKTSAHGKTKKDYLIDDPLYAYFVVNSVSTVGLFLINFYEKKYNKKVEIDEEKRKIMDVPF